jgi:hypothetical protein
VLVGAALAGTVPVTIDVFAQLVDAEPLPFVAVTMERMVLPTSLAWSV